MLVDTWYKIKINIYAVSYSAKSAEDVTFSESGSDSKCVKLMGSGGNCRISPWILVVKYVNLVLFV